MRNGFVHGLFVLTLACGWSGSSHAAVRVATHPASSDSVAVQVNARSWGSGPEPVDCGNPRWGWDSRVQRLGARDSIGFEPQFRLARFRLGALVAPDSAWLLFRPVEVLLRGRSTSRKLGWDSVLVGPTPVEFDTNSMDGGVSYRFNVASPWPGPAPRPVTTTRLFGRVTDDSLGRPARRLVARVIVLDTKIGAWTNSDGTFELTGVPLGSITVQVCAACRDGAVVATAVPRDTLVVRLRRDPRCRFE